MNLARQPGPGNSAAVGAEPTQRVGAVLEPTPGARHSPLPALETRATHLVPCRHCSALNGRSALVCWACEADLLVIGPFASAELPHPPDAAPVAAPLAVPFAPDRAVAEHAGAANGQRGLRLVSRGDVPTLVLQVPALSAPGPFGELPVLTTLVEKPLPVTAPMPVEPRAQSPYPRLLIALLITVAALLSITAGLQWWSVPAAPPRPVVGSAAPVAVDADLPLVDLGQAGALTDRRLSFPPQEVAPTDAVTDQPARVPARAKPGAPARFGRKAPETLPTVAQAVEVLVPSTPPAGQRKAAPSTCTSNMAALGFCTLEPASAEE